MEIAELVKRSRAAQQIVSGYSQEKIDSVVRMIAKVVYDKAEPLAKMAVEESRMGVYEDKVTKNKGKARILWHGLKGKRSVGILERDEKAGIVIIAKPMGVIGAATPCTNPIITPMCNAMFAIKGGNSVIIAPHPRGKNCAKRMKELYDAEFDRMGVPRDILLVVEDPTIEKSVELMKAVDVVIATGGAAMVKSAYSSGKPSFGVGPGNLQGIIDDDIDFEEAAKRMIYSRSFDNGIICSGTQTIIVSRKNYKAVIEAFIKNGAYYIDDPAKVNAFRETLFPQGQINKDTVGQSAAAVAKLAGLEIPAETKCVILRPEKFGDDDYLSDEKMCPVMTAYEYDTWEQAVEIAYANLMVEGMGHTVDIQSNNREHVEYAALRLPVSRVTVNQIPATQNGGSFQNSLSPTSTLGCGSWGNNSISENLSYYHLFNKSRIAYVKPEWNQPSDEEIFA